MLVGGGVFTWPLALIWRGDRTCTDLSKCGWAGVATQSLQVEPTALFCLHEGGRKAPSVSELVGAANHLIGCLAAGAAWGVRHSEGKDFADPGHAATRFTDAIRKDACEYRDRMDETKPRPYEITRT